MRADKEMIAKAKRAIEERDIETRNGRILVVADLPEDKIGNIILSDDAQSLPHSGIVVAYDEDTSAGEIGDRVYFRPFTTFDFNIGPDSDEVIVGSLHWKDVVMFENQP